MSKRNECEPFEEYRARRKRESDARSVHMRGVLVVTGSGSNRKPRREYRFASKHKGRPDRFACKAPALRRRIAKAIRKGSD